MKTLGSLEVLVLSLVPFLPCATASGAEGGSASPPLVVAQAQAPAADATTEPCPPPPPVSGPRNSPPSHALSYRPFPATWQAKLDKFVADKTVPGAVIIVKSPTWGVRVGAAGIANIATGEKMGPGQQFRVGSVSKVFTAQTILQLEQEGRLKLTDPVLKFLGDDATVRAIPNIDKVKIANLLQMTSGIASYTTAAINQSVRIDPTKVYTPDQLMAILGPTTQPPVKPDFTPGDSYIDPYWFELLKDAGFPQPPNYPFWSYSNSNYILLGRIIEKITGKPAGDVIQSYVMDKLGLQDTFFASDGKSALAMHGYTQLDANLGKKIYDSWCDVTATNPSYAWTAGAVVSTPWDLLHLLDAMFQTQELLNDGTKEKWLTFVSGDIHPGWAPIGYGVGGLMEPHRSYGDFRGHGGAYPGYKTLIYYFFDAQTSFVLASNTWDQSGYTGPEVNMLDVIMPLVKSAVTTPRPANNAHVTVDPGGKVKLAWQAGRAYGDSYAVYIGTDPDKVDTATLSAHDGVILQEAADNATEIPNLSPRQIYYWRIDAITKDGPVTGPLWRFRTYRR